MMASTDERLRVRAARRPAHRRPRARRRDRQRAGDDLPGADAGRLERDRHRARERLRPAPRRPVPVRARRPGALRARRRRAPRSRPSAASCCPRRRSTPALRVEEPGALDLVLDGGRLNQAHHGMAQAGPLDARAARLANALCGNAPGTTLIESTLNGPTLPALRDVVVGAAGPRLRAATSTASPAGQRTTRVRTGQTLALEATGERRARLPRDRRWHRGRALPRLDQRRPLRADRPPAARRRRARPRATRTPARTRCRRARRRSRTTS